MAKRNHRLRYAIVLFCIITVSIILMNSPYAFSQENTDKRSSQSITLQLSGRIPTTGIRSKLIAWMGKEIEKQTNGRVIIHINWNADLESRDHILKTTMNGMSDMGIIDVADYPNQLFSWSIFNTFMTGPIDPFIVSDSKRVCFENIPAFNAELKRWNQRRITFFNYLPSAISLNTPIDSTKDLKGRRMRAHSNWLQAMLVAAGGSQVALPWGDVYTALERGAIDGTLTGLDVHYSYSMDTVSKYFLYNKRQWQPQPILVTINLDIWKKINKEDRNRMLAIGKKANLLESRLASDYWDLCINEMKLRSKAEFVKMSDQELRMWEELSEVKALSQKWVTEAKAIGLPAEDILEQVKDTITAGLSKEKSIQ